MILFSILCKKIEFLFLILLSYFSLVSCKPQARVFQLQKKTSIAKSIAFYATMVDNMKLPKVNNMDAILFKKKIEPLRKDIFKLQEKHVNSYRDSTFFYLKNAFGLKVLFDDELREQPGFQFLKTNLNFADNLKTNDPFSPYIYLAEGDINSFKFNNGNVYGFLKDEASSKPAVKQICEKLNVDMLVIENAFLGHGDYAGPVGSYAVVNVVVHLYFFDKEGNLLMYGEKESLGETTSGNNILAYEVVMENHNSNSKSLVTAMVKRYKKITRE